MDQSPTRQIHPAMMMSPQERREQADEKRVELLNFLGSGEVWSSLSVIAVLLQRTEQTARRLVKRLVSDGYVKIDTVSHLGGSLRLYGITRSGLEFAPEAHPLCRPFELGKTSPENVSHHLDTQYVRLFLQDQGWTDWVPEKILLLSDTETRRKSIKIPDAIGLDRSGIRKAIEVERYVKSADRLTQAISGHVGSILQKKYGQVIYFSPQLEKLKRAFNSIEIVNIESLGLRKISEDQIEKLFQFYDLNQVKNLMKEKRAWQDKNVGLAGKKIVLPDGVEMEFLPKR